MKHYTDKELTTLWEQSCKADIDVSFETYERMNACVSLRREIDILQEMRRLETVHSDLQTCWNLLKAYTEFDVDYYRMLAEVKGGL